MRRLILLASVCFLYGCALQRPSAELPRPGVRAAVFVVIDQLGSDVFAGLKTGPGFRELKQRALLFPRARYEVLHPETCPGHATIATGTYPWKHGVVGNLWREDGGSAELYCVEDASHKVSPRRLMRPVFADLMRKAGFKVEALSVSGKDRAAVMMGGHDAEQVLWYDSKSGAFKSSSYYPAVSPVVRQFNSEQRWRKYFAEPWQVARNTAIPYGYAIEPDTEFFDSIYRGPAVDRLTFELFSRLASEQAARSRDAFHVMSLSLSAADTVGHRFGPASSQYRSVLAQVDSIMKELLSLLDKLYGQDGYLLVVTSDHGVFPIEEKGRRAVSADEVTCARAGRKCPGLVERICFDALSPESKWYDYAQHSHFAGRGEGCTQIFDSKLMPFGGPGTSHLTPYSVDTDVPLWLMVPGRTSAPHDGIVSPVSIVPSLLDALGLKTGSAFDGPSLLAAAD